MTAPSTIQGVGIGLRHQHFPEFRNSDDRPDVPWLEVHSENFFSAGSAACVILDEIRTHYPLSAHCVGLSLGSAERVDAKHLGDLKAVVTRYEPSLVSDHVSWSGLDGTYFPDLLPLPYTEDALSQLVDNITQVQDALGRQILVENPSSYITFADSQLPEAEFMVEVATRAGCGLLLDVNNIHVSCHNHGWNENAYIDKILSVPEGTIQEIHLAGYTESSEFRVQSSDHPHPNPLPEGEGIIFIDDHGAPVHAPVWELFRKVTQRLPETPTLIEWDNNVPALDVLLAEKAKADAIWDASSKSTTPATTSPDLSRGSIDRQNTSGGVGSN